MPAPVTSGTTYYTSNRDAVIKRALRIVGGISQGQTPSATAVTEAAEALNDICKEWQADGMPLWKIVFYTPFAYTATETYLIGTGSTVNQPAPLKLLYAFNRNNSVTPVLDSPMIIVPKFDYAILGNKQSTGRPSQLMYTPPGTNTVGANGDFAGEIRVYPLPDAYTIANVTCGIIGQKPFEDFNASTDVPDFPSYWVNALKWGLADQLSYEYGLPYAERSMITKKAENHKQVALSFGSEEVSLFIQPYPQWADTRSK